jgi:signal transduction histidine kinase
MLASRDILCGLILFGLGPVPSPAAPGDPAEPLTNAAAVLSLTGEQASRRFHISVTGVVTAAEADWTGQFFVQDATGGVFVENTSRPGPAPGEIVTVEGVSHPGAFAPIISAPRWRVLGTASLPEPKSVSPENLMAGVEDGLRVEITGVIRTARIEASRLTLDLAVGGFRLQVNAPVPSDTRPESLIGARMRVRGTAATHYNAAVRHLTSVAVYVPRLDDLTIVEPEGADPFSHPVIPVNNVAQYHYGRKPDQRVHVHGVVTLQRIGAEVFLQDDSGGIRVECTQPDTFVPGDHVDAVGFIEYENYLPLLRDGVLRRTDENRSPVPPRVVPFVEISRGQHHGDLITLRGRILDRTTRPVARPHSDFSGFSTTWLLQGDTITFTVEHEATTGNAGFAAIPIGSRVEVDGVCVCTVDPAGSLTSLKLLLPSPSSLRLLQRPSWMTPGRLLAGVGLLSVGLILVLSWLLTVSKKNAALKELIRAREHAQRELQEAHDTLEQRVAERTAQLQVEMTARKTAEVQFKAVLAERTRLARDLHDTLEQTLTGIALHLDTTAKLAQRDPTASNEHLQLARNWLRQSQVELRRSIWDLRSRELEQFDLPNTLRRSAEMLVDGTSVQLEFQTKGDQPRLPEIVEENVLRIGQEALTNIAKHAQATRVAITLEFTLQALLLRVEDNGVGFAPRQSSSPGDGHFGLMGMTERAKRLGGRLAINSIPGRGTSVMVEIPLEPAGAAPPPPTKQPTV